MYFLFSYGTGRKVEIVYVVSAPDFKFSVSFPMLAFPLSSLPVRFLLCFRFLQISILAYISFCHLGAFQQFIESQRWNIRGSLFNLLILQMRKKRLAS